MWGAEAKPKSVPYSHDWQRLEFRVGTCGSSRRVSSSSRECWEATLAGVANAPPLGVPKLPLALGRWGVRLTSSAEPCSAARPRFIPGDEAGTRATRIFQPHRQSRVQLRLHSGNHSACELDRQAVQNAVGMAIWAHGVRKDNERMHRGEQRRTVESTTRLRV